MEYQSLADELAFAQNSSDDESRIILYKWVTRTRIHDYSLQEDI